MNMKKSIAGVMAGAMAVSAMAAVVSADQDAISLTYDLKTYVNNLNKEKAKVTVVANYEGSLVSEESVKAGYITFGADNGYVRSGDIYNKDGIKIGTVAAKGTWNEAVKVTADNSKLVDFEFTARPYADVHDPNKILEEKYQTFKATGDAKNVDGAYYDKKMAKDEISYYEMKINTDSDDTAGKFDLRKYDLFTLGYSSPENAKAAGLKEAVTKTTYGVRDAVAKLTYEIPNTVKLNKANGWGWDVDLKEDKLNNFVEKYYYDTLTGDVTMSAEVFSAGFFNAAGEKKGMIRPDNATALVSDPTTVAVGAFTAGAAKEIIVPFKTTLKPTELKPEKQTGIDWEVTKADGSKEIITTPENDVIAALQNRKAGGNYYTRPLAVINDAIANHDNVVFTFTSYGGYVATEKSHLMNQWVEVGAGYDYETSGKDFDWHNPTFGQHLYTNVKDSYSLFDSDEYDMYGSYSSAWGINLFTGAVVVNKNLTMQLNDTDTFNWGNNTLSFDWFDIIDDGKITDAKTFLTSMLLYTPVDWYWDSLTVVVSDEEDEAVDAGEGLDGEGEVIEDEEPEVVEDEPEVEVEPEVVETEAAPVETAPSPATGNAPVALAVIPVALAAAAVVAKKRG